MWERFAHWGFAARRYTRETSWVYLPTSNLEGDGPRPVGGSMTAFGLYDIAGNVREWNRNRIGSGRLTRGGAWDDAAFHVGYLIERPSFDRSPQNGVRLVRHFESDTTAAHFYAKITPGVVRDFTDAVPAPAAETAIYLRLFDYDPLPLEPEEELLDSTRHYRMEKVTFAAAYGNERMTAYVFLPRDTPPPYQPIIFWPGSGAMTQDRAFDHVTEVQGRHDYIMRSGRAFIWPLYQGSYERDDAEFSTRISTPRPTTYYRDLTVQWIKDFRRTVDWIETRSDMDADRVGFLGFSWGGQIAPIVLAAEPRVKAAALNIGGLWRGAAALPEVEALHYLPLVTVPVLMLNGRYDVVFPYETTQVPFFNLLGTPPDQKKHYLYPSSHSVPRDEAEPATLEWFDRYLGPVGR